MLRKVSPLWVTDYGWQGYYSYACFQGVDGSVQMRWIIRLDPAPINPFD
jgi:hypothetical protein